jgi:hypothetical protein
MISTAAGIESLTLTVNQEIKVSASLEDTFEALLEQIGTGNETPEGQAIPMTIEPWPGGGGFAIWARAMATFGEMSRPSSGPPSSKFRGRCSCHMLRPTTCSTG